MTRLRIEVRANEPDFAWPFTARLQEWDGSQWRELDAEDGDSALDAEVELRERNPRARRIAPDHVIRA